MEKDFIKRVRSVSDIYSLVVELFRYLEKETKQEIQKRRNLAYNTNISASLNILDNLVSELYIINRVEFSQWLENWIREFINRRIDAVVFCYEFLVKIDKEICEIMSDEKVILSRGPLCVNDGYYFYFKEQDFYFKNKLKKGKIFRGRQSVEYDTNSINSDFENFEVIKYSCLHDYQPEVARYSRDLEFTDKLRIGFSSISKEKWFEINTDSITKELLIEYAEHQIKKQNENLKKILLESERRAVDIVIFPELALNPESEKEICRFIIESNLEHVKLCFLGSVWDNNINEAILMSNQGTVLLREKKKEPYRRYIKEEHCYYTESIHSDQKIQYVDIIGLGRIAYLICADFNNDTINTINSIMHTNFVFVSAFSNSTDEMQKTADSNAERKAISTILCNSCAAEIDKGSYNAIAVVPDVVNRHLITNEIYKGLPLACPNMCELCVETVTIEQS